MPLAPDEAGARFVGSPLRGHAGLLQQLLALLLQQVSQDFQQFTQFCTTVYNAIISFWQIVNKILGGGGTGTGTDAKSAIQKREVESG